MPVSGEGASSVRRMVAAGPVVVLVSVASTSAEAAWCKETGLSFIRCCLS